jgi:hypothetical protein
MGSRLGKRLASKPDYRLRQIKRLSAERKYDNSLQKLWDLIPEPNFANVGPRKRGCSLEQPEKFQEQEKSSQKYRGRSQDI